MEIAHMGPSELLILAWLLFTKAIVVILAAIIIYFVVRKAVRVEMGRALRGSEHSDSELG